MRNATMGKKKRPETSPEIDQAAESDEPGKSDEPGRLTSLKCFQAEAELIGKAAGVRGQSIANLMRSKEVRRFFLHLIVAAGQQAEKSLEEEDPKSA